MPKYREIRADYDRSTIVVYQAYKPEIADAAVKAGRFVPPFSMTRMTWIKPSFLWMMERCGWARKAGQERVLAVRILRSGWEGALSKSVLTHPDESVYRDGEAWEQRKKEAVVQIQWDPERDLRGISLEYRSIQVGLSRQIVEQYVDEWTQEIVDVTPVVTKMYDLIRSGRSTEARRFLPQERIYPVPEDVGRCIGLS